MFIEYYYTFLEICLTLSKKQKLQNMQRNNVFHSLQNVLLLNTSHSFSFMRDLTSHVQILCNVTLCLLIFLSSFMLL